MNPPSSSPVTKRRRPGRRAAEIEELGIRRLDIDLNAAEYLHCHASASAAEMPVRRWARRVLLGTPISVATPRDLRALWTESSTLQSQANQLVERLNQLNRSGELTLENAAPTLHGLVKLAPELLQLVRQMRLELADGGSR